MAIISPLPYTIVNGQAVDATPVMADLNQIVADVNANAAALNGSASQVFNAAPAATSTEAVPLGQADGRYAALAGSSTQVFNAAPATTSTEVVTLGQLAQYLPIGAENDGASVATLSVTTSSFTAPCAGKAMVFFSGVNVAGQANTMTVGSSASGFATVTLKAFGTGYDAFGYLPMTAGQSATFNMTANSVTATSIMVMIKVLFQPLA